MIKRKLPIYYFLFLFLFFACDSRYKNSSYPADNDNTEFSKGSGIELSNISEEQVENLVVLGKIWGFLKYYHPAIAKGNYNWDYELFKILPEILNVSSKKQREKVLIGWIKKLGNVEQGNRLKKDKNIIIYPDLNWIDTLCFESKLVKLLLKIKYAKRNSVHHYIKFTYNVGNPIFTNENSYKDISFPDAGYRLLALFRYWNIINYFFPYKYLIDTSWEQVLREFIPKFVHAKIRLDYQSVILEMITKINDSHVSLYYEEKEVKKFDGYNIVPMEIIFIGDTAVVSGFFKKDFEESTELKRGDIILKINGKSIVDMINERKKYMPASNRSVLLRNMASEFLQTDEESLKIEYLCDSIVKQIEVPTYKKYSISVPNKFYKKDTCFKFIESNISYLYLGSIKEEYLSDLLKFIKNSKGLIIDLRCYPNDNSVMFTLCEHIINYPTAFVRTSQGNVIYPGTFTYTQILEIGRSHQQSFKGKIAILINEITLSHAEFSAMAYRTAPNAKVFGSPTAGADGNVSEIYLPGGLKTSMSGIGVYYPDGRETQRIGILPDVEVKPTIKGIKEGRDEVLERAIAWIKEK
jgi:C-terminal processing protease CtpA/Prc